MYYRPTLLYLCILIINHFFSIDMQKPKKLTYLLLIDFLGPP